MNIKPFADNWEEYLKEDYVIDYSDKNIAELADLLYEKAADETEYIKLVYEYVRDNISHSADINEDLVSCTASEVLREGHGMQQGFNSNNIALMQGFNGVQAGQNAIANQIANCCCETQRLIERGFCDVGYAMATNTNNIIQSQHNDTDRVIAKLDQMEATRQAEKIAALRDENQNLRFAASQAQQNGVIRAAIDASTAEILRRSGHECPSAAYLVQPPTPVNFPVNGCGTVQFGNGYGCGNGCGCGGCCA